MSVAMNEIKPLQPLTNGGVVLIVGAKASNFDEEIKSHPRVVIWDSQQEHWTDKDMPLNTRAVFLTRFLSHAAFGKITGEARKRNINIFNPGEGGTGIIARQVKELLGIGARPPVEEHVERPHVDEDTGVNSRGKLNPLLPFIDYSKSNAENARVLLAKAGELGIETTEGSLSNLVGYQRRKRSETGVPKSLQSKLDVAVQLLDNAVKDISDMRQFLVETVEENKALRLRVEKFRKVLEED